MGKVRGRGFGVSIDGFGAGSDQSLEHPLGKGGPDLQNWFYPTRAFSPPPRWTAFRCLRSVWAMLRRAFGLIDRLADGGMGF